MEAQVSENIGSMLHGSNYEIPQELEEEINSCVSIMLLQNSVGNESVKNNLARANAQVSSLKWQLEQEKNLVEQERNKRVKKDTSGYILLKEHNLIKDNLAKKLRELEQSKSVPAEQLEELRQINKALTETNELLSVDLDSLKPSLEQSHEANRQLIIKLDKSKEKVQAAIAREEESGKKFLKANELSNETIKMLRSERAVQNSNVKVLKDKVAEMSVDLKDSRELVAISGRQVLWENKRRGTYLTYLGVRDVGESKPQAVDGTELDMNKPIFQFHHPSGVSRMVLCGAEQETAVVFCANSAPSMPTEKERREISELVETINFGQVQEYFDKQQAQRESRSKFVSERTKEINNSGSLSQGKAKKALKELNAGGKISEETAKVVTDAHLLAENDLLNKDDKLVEVRVKASKMSESKRNKNRSKRKNKKKK